MSAPGEYADRLAALDARLSRLLDAVRRTRHDLESHRERTDRARSQRERGERDQSDREHGDRLHSERGGERAGLHRRVTGEWR